MVAPRPDYPEASRPHFAEIMARTLGPELCVLLADPDLTDLYVNPDGLVRIDRRGAGRRLTDIRLPESRTIAFLNAVATSIETTLSESRPTLQAELPSDIFRGGRLQAFVPPVVRAASFILRFPSAAIFSLDELVDSSVLSPAHAARLRQAILERDNVLIAGGTGSGKTTLLNSLLAEIQRLCPDDRLLVLEDTIELRSPVPDTLPLRTVPGVTLADLVAGSLRSLPSRIIVGEVRDHVALDLIDAWGTGHPGGLATLHATDPHGALLRLDRLAQRNRVPSQLPTILETIDLIAMTAGGNTGRRVTDLVRVGRPAQGDDLPVLTAL
jgi:type IV secretion system protein VirB11